MFQNFQLESIARNQEVLINPELKESYKYFHFHRFDKLGILSDLTTSNEWILNITIISVNKWVSINNYIYKYVEK